MNFKEPAQLIKEEIIRHRRRLHTMPELGLHLPKTANYIGQALHDLDIPWQPYLEGSGLIALIGRTGPTLALRADMDGLPIQEATGLAYASKNGAMHACGHDGHMAALLGATKLLKAVEDQLPGRVKLIFQPGEEYPGGALPMIQAGCLEDPEVSAIFGLHAGHLHPELAVGKVGTKAGPVMASMDRFLIKVRGKGVHGAYPNQGVDAIVTASQLVLALQTIVSREIPPTSPAILSVCRIQGGTNQNILPDEVALEGTVRATSEDVRKFIQDRIFQISEALCQQHRATCDITYDVKYPVLINHAAMTNRFFKSAEKILAPGDIQELTVPIMGGEDMAFYQERVPGCFFFLANPMDVDGTIYPHHNSRFDLDDAQLAKGSALLAQLAWDYLNEI